MTIIRDRVKKKLTKEKRSGVGKALARDANVSSIFSSQGQPRPANADGGGNQRTPQPIAAYQRSRCSRGS
jgi:hypothetical protein